MIGVQGFVHDVECYVFFALARSSSDAMFRRRISSHSIIPEGTWNHSSADTGTISIASELIGICFWARPDVLSTARVSGALCFLIRCDNSLACMVMLPLPVEILVFRFEAFKAL